MLKSIYNNNNNNNYYYSSETLEQISFKPDTSYKSN